MALPTIDFDMDAAGAGASTIEIMLPKLHSMLVSAGWTIVYADSDAIGTGSGSNPAWTKTEANSTDAGTVVYRMPANDQTTQWFVKFTARWGAAANRPYITHVQAGTAHDGSGNLSGGGPGITHSTPGNVNSAVMAHQIAVSEDGLAIVWDGGNGPYLFVERVRTADGTVTDDLLVVLRALATTGNVLRASYTAASGEDLVSDLVFLGRVQQSGTESALVTVATLVSEAGDSSVLVGPYLSRKAMLAAPPRLLNYIAGSDAAAGATVQQHVDGGAKVYQVGSINRGPGYLAVATE